jgi:geranylgeranyl pyrophosphate synthase
VLGASPATGVAGVSTFSKKTAPEKFALHRAIYAGPICTKRLDVLKIYSEALGIAYQIRDDLSDLGASGETNDLAGLRPSLLLAVAHEKAKDAQKEQLASVWRRQLPAGVSSEQVEALYFELKADERARTLLETYKEEAIRSLRDLENASLKGLLRRVIGKIFNDTEIKGWCKEFEQKNAAGRMPEVVLAK